MAPGGGGSGGTDPAHLPATVADPAGPQADHFGNGEGGTPHVAVAEDAGQPNAPMSRLGSCDWKARYPAGYGDEPPPDFLGRRSWHLISTHGGQIRPKAGELWRFLVDATPGSQESADKRWVQVLIPLGQEEYVFAARPELRIPGAAPMTYVDDPMPATVPCWYDEDENGPGYYSEQYSPPRLVLDAWGHIPAQEAAAAAGATSRAEAGLHWDEMQAKFSYLPGDTPLARPLA